MVINLYKIVLVDKNIFFLPINTKSKSVVSIILVSFRFFKDNSLYCFLLNCSHLVGLLRFKCKQNFKCDLNSERD